MNNKSNVHKIFSSIAKRYDALNTVLSLGIDKSWRKKTIDLCNLNKDDKVLDLCSGTGQMLDYICPKVGKDNEVIALDFNEEMMKVGKVRLENILNGYKFKFVHGDVMNLPYEDGTFDCITIAFGLRNAPDKNITLKEIYRVLKPNGRLLCLELSSPDVPIFRQLYSFYFNNILPIIGYIGSGDKEAYYYLRNSVNTFMKKKELKLAFENAGFKNTFYKSLTFGTAAIHYGEKD